MKPYYEDTRSGITIYHGDCLDLLPSVAAAVLVTDPPYGLQALAGYYGRHYDTIRNDEDTSARDSALALWGDRPACVFGSPRMPEPPGAWEHRLVWDKCEPGMNGGPWRYTHESIFVRGAGWLRRNDSAFSILRVATGNWAAGRGVHPHRKPVALMEKLVSAAPDGVIVDAFCGSGSTLVAAKNMGRRAIGIEIEERYCEIAARRLAQEVLFPVAT